MMRDILTVTWREQKCFLRGREKRYQSVLTLLVPLVFFGLILPWQAGSDWLEGFHPVLAASAIPLVMAMLTAPDSFAGERERHTLATLLATRLPDGAVLWGKILWNVALAWGLTVVVLTLGLVAANGAVRDSGLVIYDPAVGVGCFCLSFLFALLAVGVSIPVSLRAATTQEATYAASALLLLPPIAGIVVLIALRSINPGWSVDAQLAGTDRWTLLGLALGALALVDAALLLWARKIFRRSRLIAG